MNNTVTIEIVDTAAVRFLHDLAAISLIRFTPETTVDKDNNVKNSVFGRLNAYANPSLIQEETNAWENAVAEKYAVY